MSAQFTERKLYARTYPAECIKIIYDNFDAFYEAGEEYKSMQPIVSQIHKLLIKKQKKVAVAESCTGGFISNLLTQAPGSSQYFNLGLVTYSNQTKERILKIPTDTIVKYGAVSRKTAGLMAKKVRIIAKTDFGIGVSGIAGPSGGSKEKPIGTVFIALASKNRTICKKFHFTGNRLAVRKKTALRALKILKTLI